jgi:hypothetical protein
MVEREGSASPRRRTRLTLNDRPMISVADFRKLNPGVRVVDYGGAWLVVYCHGVGVRYDSREQADKEAREECAYCARGRVNDHPIYELQLPPVRKATSYRCWERD